MCASNVYASMRTQRWTQLVIFCCLVPLTTGAPSLAKKKPNIILLLVDDVDHLLGSDSPERLPQMNKHIAQQGINFTHFFVNYALCCPSRTSILTGRCSHNTGVIDNNVKGMMAGEERFIAQGHENRTVATWLKEAGYRTGLVGKYLNGYGYTDNVNPTHIPPGWDEWMAFIDIDYYNWSACDNGKKVHYGWDEADYSTDVLKERAIKFLKDSNQDDRPFFLYLTPYAAHSPEIPAPRHEGAFAGLKIPRTPNWPGLYPQISEKASALRLYPRLQDKFLKLFDFTYQKRAETLLAVDEMIEEIVMTLDASGQLDNTYIFFTSDNGYHLGHHRMSAGKTAPYEEDIHLFLYVRGPNVPQGVKLDHVLGNIDLAATIADLAGAVPATPPEAPVDGISFAPLLRDPWSRTLNAEKLRAGFLIEKILQLSDPDHVTDQVVINDRANDAFARYRRPQLSFWEEASLPPPAPPLPNATVGKGDHAFDSNIVNRGGELTEDGKAIKNGPFGAGVPGTQYGPYVEKHGFSASDYEDGNGFVFPGTYYGVRISNKLLGEVLYLEAGGFGHELYNMSRDPYQLHNIFAHANPSLIAYLQNLLDKLKYCKGSASCSPSAYSVPHFALDSIPLADCSLRSICSSQEGFDVKDTS